MGDGGHDGELTACGEDAGTETNEDLGEGQDAGVGAGSAERNQQAGSEEGDGYTSHRDPLEIASVADEHSDQRAEDGRCKRERVEDVSGVCDALPVNDLQVRVEHGVPAEY